MLRLLKFTILFCSASWDRNEYMENWVLTGLCFYQVNVKLGAEAGCKKTDSMSKGVTVTGRGFQVE